MKRQSIAVILGVIASVLVALSAQAFLTGNPTIGTTASYSGSVTGGTFVATGSSSGTATITAPAAAGTPTLTLPTATGTIVTNASTGVWRSFHSGSSNAVVSN